MLRRRQKGSSQLCPFVPSHSPPVPPAAGWCRLPAELPGSGAAGSPAQTGSTALEQVPSVCARNPDAPAAARLDSLLTAEGPRGQEGFLRCVLIPHQSALAISAHGGTRHQPASLADRGCGVITQTQHNLQRSPILAVVSEKSHCLNFASLPLPSFVTYLSR